MADSFQKSERTNLHSAPNCEKRPASPYIFGLVTVNVECHRLRVFRGYLEKWSKRSLPVQSRNGLFRETNVSRIEMSPPSEKVGKGDRDKIVSPVSYPVFNSM